MTAYRDHFVTFARYNIWANTRLYDACAGLPQADYHAGRPAAFFGSIHGTLNHLLLVDRAWMQRITGEGDVPTSLDEELYKTLPTLRAARDAEDKRILLYVEDLDDAELARSVSYSPLTAGPETRSVAHLLSHLFNHDTHHRGQAHALLQDAGIDPPPLDLMYYLREAG